MTTTTDRDQLREALETKYGDDPANPRAAAISIVDGIRGHTFEFDNLGDHGYWYDRVEELVLAALATPTALDPATIEHCAQIATSFLVGDPKNGVPLRNPMAHEIAAAIRASVETRT